MNVLKKAMSSFRNSFYSRMVIIYSSIIISSLFLLILLFIGHQNKNLKNQKIEDLTNVVSQFQIFSDQYFLDNIYTIMVKDIFQESRHGLEILNDSTVYKYNANDYSHALEMKKFVTTLQERRDFIESITIYNKDYNTYVSSKSGVLYKINDKVDKYTGIVDYGLLSTIEGQDLNQFWISVAQNKAFYKEKSILSFVQLMPIFLPPAQYDIAIAIHIDLNKVYAKFFSELNTEKDNFKILDGQNNLIFDTDTNNLFLNGKAPEIGEQVGSGDQGHFVSQAKGGSVYTIWRTSDVNDWKYIYTSKDTASVGNILNSLKYIFLGYFILSIGVLFVILFIGKWLYRPLNKLVDVSSKRLTGIVPENDLTIINTAFSSINTKLEKLEDIVEKNDTLIFNNIIHDLVNGKIDEVEKLNERLRLLNKECKKDSFYVLLIKIDAQAYAQLNYKEKEVLRITIDEMVSRHYEEPKDSFKIATLFDYEGYFTCIINLNEEEYEEELENAKALFKVLNGQFTSIFNFSITKPFKALSYFYNYTQEALGYFKYSFIYGNNNIFTEESIMEYEKNSIELNAKVIHNIEVLLKTQKFGLLKENLLFLFNEIKIDGYSFLYMYNLSIKIIAIISHECTAQNISAPALSQQSLLQSYSQINHLEDCINWFYSVIDIFEENINVRNMNMDSTIIQDIVSYIQNNVDAQLSLNSVADHFNVSTGHLSRLFKEKAGSNFSDFVSHVKFEKAAAILLSDGKAKVSDIAEALGYSNLTYFTKLFKEKYGMTPTQYRKVHKAP